MRRPFARFVPAFVLLAAAGAAADRIHLESGGTIDTPRWWIDGDKLMYRGAAGTIGIPRSMVLRIESSETPPSTDRGTAPSRPTRNEERLRGELRETIAEARSFLEQRDYERASAAYHHALMIAPESYEARVRFVFCELQLNEDASALNAALDGLVHHPEGAELHELVGDLRDREERLEDALASWRRAFELKPGERLRDKIEKAERDLASRRDFEFARTTHFNIRYDGDVDGRLAAEVSEHLEQEYWRLSRRFDHAPQQPITTLLYPDKAFQDVTRAENWVAGLYDGKIRVPLGGLERLHGAARRVLTHELTHAVVHSKSHGHSPRWLHEGLAQLSEGRRLGRREREEVRAVLTAAEAPERWEEAGFSYAAALSFTSWLEQRRDFSHLVWLLDLLGEGRDLDAALRRVYGESYAALCRRWAQRELRGTTS